MKVLILDDERAERLLDMEARADGKPRAVKGRRKPPQLPDAKELVAMARNGGDPEVFTSRRDQLEALTEAADQIRGELHDLIKEADAVGIPPRALTRWSGYHPRRVYQIAHEQ